MMLRDIIDKVAIPSPRECTTKAERRLATEDLLPVVAAKRQWSGLAFVSFWIADAWNINVLQIAATGMTSGLAWWQALISIALGYTLSAPFLVANGRPGAFFHIRFPAVARSSFGIWGSYWLILNRTVMSMVWWGVQAWIGGGCVALFLRAIFPSYANIPNGMESAGTTTQQFLGFFIFWLLSLPTVWPPIEKARHLFLAKAIIAPIGGFAFLIWALVRSKGLGPLLHEPPKLTGTAAVFPMVSSMMAALSNASTVITNNCDISAMARSPSSALLPQLLSLPLCFIITSLMGILIASSSQVVYGSVIWDPIEHLGRFLDGNPGHATRFGVAMIALCFVYVQLILNLSANSIGAGCDMTALFPRRINIRRGSFVCIILALAWQPWRIMASSNSFTSYLGAYSVFLSSFCGVMLCDYYLVRRGRYRVADLYTGEAKGWYYYTKGCNIRAFVAYLFGIAPNMPGFINSVVSAGGGSAPISHIADKIYAFSWFTGIIVSMSVYYLLNMIWPAAGNRTKERFLEVDESEYEEYGLASSPKSTVNYTEQSPEEADLDDIKKANGEETTSHVVDVAELRA